MPKRDKNRIIMNRIIIPILLVTATMTACLEIRYYENEEILLTDRTTIYVKSEVSIPDDVEVYDQNIYDTLIVKTNRSFHAKLEPEVEWASIVEQENVNLSGISEEVPLILVFARNRKDLSRETTLIISGEEKTLTIPVTQNAPVFYIETKLDKEIVLGVRDTSKLRVRSNTKWTAEIDETRTDANVTLSKISGRDNGTVLICFGMNNDFDSQKKAVIIISSEKCESKYVTVTQRDGSPFVTFLENDFTEAPESHYIPVSVTANVPWSISVKESNFSNGVIVTRESYLANPKSPEKWIEVSNGTYIEGLRLAYVADHGADPTADKEAILYVRTDDGTSFDTITIRQQGCIHLDFLDINPDAVGTDKPYRDCYDAESWPFDYPSYQEMCFSWNGCMLDPIKYPFDGHLYGEIQCILKCGYTMPIRTNGYEGDLAISKGGGFWYQRNSKGLQLSYCINGYDYLKTPIVPGMALKKLIFEPSSLGLNTAYMRECGGSDDALELPPLLPGAKKWAYKNSPTAYEEHETIFEYIFEKPEKETSYRLSFEQTTCCSSIKELVFIYEK